MPATNQASIIQRALNGLVCIYKPSGSTIEKVRSAFVTRLCAELNNLNVRPPSCMVEIAGATNAPMKVNVVENLSDHPLVVGPRYLQKDFNVSYGASLGKYTSGVFLFGLNKGTKLTYDLYNSRPVRTYRVDGQFGLATDTYFYSGKVVEKAQFKHVTREKIDRVVAHMQAVHQRKMYEMCGLDMSSQAAYELACKGLIRPKNLKIPVVYGIKCLQYEKPDFVLEIQSINEYEKYLHTFVHDIGLQLRTVAHCTKAIRIREGIFTLEHALLSKHWNLQNIIDNICMCDELLKLYGNPTRQTAELKLISDSHDSGKYLYKDRPLMIKSC